MRTGAIRLWPLLLWAFTGCSYAGAALNGAGIVLGLFRSPLVIPTSPPNDPLTSHDRAGLERLAAEVWYQSERYPLDVDSARLSRTLSPLSYDKSARHVVTPRDAFDDLCDLRGERRRGAIVFVAFSGGGARAAVLAAHSMALLEKRYNELTTDAPPTRPFSQAVDVYSSVSGGSFYAYHVALETARQRAEASYQEAMNGMLVEPIDDPCPTAVQRERWDRAVDGRTAAADVARRYASSLSEPGFESGLLYFNITPAHSMFYGPLSTLFTDNTYLQFMATSLQYNTARDMWSKELTRPEGLRRLYASLDQSQVTLGLLGDRPRFFFNTTSLETGGPFVLTQRMIHLPSDSYEPTSARADVALTSDARFARPLGHATTLEAINASPARFPLASAAMASAAFPIGMDPLSVRRFGYNRSDATVYETAQEFRLADGGVWDNSGLLTLTDLTRHIRTYGGDAGEHPLRLILISVNAETEVYDPTRLLLQPAEEHGTLDWIRSAAPLIPLRVGNIYPSLNLIHYTNKRRAEQIAMQSVEQISKRRADGEQALYYFPISLTQLSAADPYHLADFADLFERVQEIGTNYTINRSDPMKLAEAAAAIVTSPQGKCKGWFVGPACGGDGMTEVQRLDDAVAIALFRTNADLWPSHGDDPLMSIESFRRRSCADPEKIPPTLRECEQPRIDFRKEQLLRKAY